MCLVALSHLLERPAYPRIASQPLPPSGDRSNAVMVIVIVRSDRKSTGLGQVKSFCTTPHSSSDVNGFVRSVTP